MIDRLCAAQTSCTECPIGKAAKRMVLDCDQFIAMNKETALKIAQKWEEGN